MVTATNADSGAVAPMIKMASFGGDFYAPFNDRWALQSGFNYIIPDKDAGRLGRRG